MKAFLPSNFTKDSMYFLLNSVISPDYQPIDSTIEFNFTNLTFIEPAGVTVLSNLFEWLKSKNCTIKILTNYPKNSRTCPIKYLDDSGFFKFYLGSYLQETHQKRKTTFPLAHVTYQMSYQLINFNFIPWLAGQLNVTRESLDNIKVSIEEVFNNINDHAQVNSGIGCIYAQHYPKMNQVKIAISDFGVGIPNNIRKRFPSLNDGEAIEKALQYKLSTESTPKNRGVGLDHLITNVTKNHNGTVFIHSYHGILKCTYGNNDFNTIHTLKTGSYPGTLIEIIFRTDTVENIFVEEEDLEW